MACMASKAYILILLTCLPVILGQSPTSPPAESPKSGPSLKPILDADELLKNAGGDHQKALIANLQAMLVLLNQTISSIDKTLPSIADRNVSSCVKISREEYVSVIKVIVQGIEKLKRDERWIGNSTNDYIAEEFYYTREIFRQNTEFSYTGSPFYKENIFLEHMAANNFHLTEKFLTAEEEEEGKLAKSRQAELLKKAGGDYRNALIANLQAMLVQLNQTITAIDKTLPSLKDRSVSSCVARARNVYVEFIDELEEGIETLKKNKTWSPNDQDLFEKFSFVKILFEAHAALNPFFNENNILHKMALPNNGLIEGVPEEDTCQPAKTRPLESPTAKELLKNAGGDPQKALIANLQAMLVQLNLTITAIDKALPSLSMVKSFEAPNVRRSRDTYTEAIKAIEESIEIVRKNERGSWRNYYLSPSIIVEKFEDVDLIFNDYPDPTHNPFKKENDALHDMANINLELSNGLSAISC